MRRERRSLSQQVIGAPGGSRGDPQVEAFRRPLSAKASVPLHVHLPSPCLQPNRELQGCCIQLPAWHLPHCSQHEVPHTQPLPATAPPFPPLQGMAPLNTNSPGQGPRGRLLPSPRTLPGRLFPFSLEGCEGRSHADIWGRKPSPGTGWECAWRVGGPSRPGGLQEAE